MTCNLPIHGIFVSISTLLRGNLTLWYHLCDWMNGQLDSMAKVLDEALKPSDDSINGSQVIPTIPISKMGRYF